MATPLIEVHLSEVIIKRLYKIQEKVLHELSARHFLLSEQYQNLSSQHSKLKQYWDQLQVEKSYVEASKKAITTSVQEIYNRVPWPEVEQQVTKPQDQLQ